jgi:hypothetical protein
LTQAIERMTFWLRLAAILKSPAPDSPIIRFARAVGVERDQRASGSQRWIVDCHSRSLARARIRGQRKPVSPTRDGLSSDEVLALFEDREEPSGSALLKVSSRFREWPVTPLSVKQGLSNSNATSVLPRETEASGSAPRMG